jgi:cephalosporin hydroxylase
MSFVKSLKDEVRLARALMRKRIFISSRTEKEIVRGFHTLYYDSHLLGKSFFSTFWLGVPTLKCPLDLWVYQEILHEIKPDLIIETGTAKGGSALFLASIFDLIGNGEVVSIDIEENDLRPQHKRIRYLLGSSTSDEIVSAVTTIAAGKRTVLVILDSDHSQAHVFRELTIYSRLVTKGSYLIVEDTNVNGHPVDLEHGPGPMEALDEFLATNKDFVIDEEKEKFLMTFNPRGYLRRTN